MTEEKQDGAAANSGLSAASEYVQIFMINVGLSKATDLKKADMMGKSDPYLRVTAFGQTYTTKTIMKTLNPVWNEKTTFVFFADPGKLHFEVWDWDKGTKDDSIGDVDLSLAGFFEQGSEGFAGQLKLQNVKKGEIHVSVSCRKLVPSELEEKAKALAFDTEQQRDQIAGLTEAIAATTAANATLATEIGELEAGIATCKNDTAETEKDIAARQVTQGELKEELGKAEEEAKAAQEKCDAAQEEARGVEAELNKARNQLDKAKEENENLEHESNNLEKQVREAQAEKRREEQEKAAAAKRASSAKATASKHASEDSRTGLNEESIDVAPPAGGKCCAIL